MYKPKRKTLFAAFALIISLCIVTTAFAGVNDSADSLPRKSQWTAEQAGDSIIQVPPQAPKPDVAQSPSRALQDGEAYAANRIIVKYKDNTHAESATAKSVVTKVTELASIDAKLMEVTEGTDIISLIEQLKNDPNVLYAEPDYKVHSTNIPNQLNPTTSSTASNATYTTYDLTSNPTQASASTASAAAAATSSQASDLTSQASSPLPKDERFPEQWALNNTGQTLYNDYFPGTPGMDIGALDAWKITKGDSKVVVAVIGSGVDPSIDDLQGQLWEDPSDPSIHGWNFVQDNSKIFEPEDGSVENTGTLMAGIIAAAENGVGVVGVAPNVKVMPLKVFNGNYEADVSDILKAIEYAQDNGAQIAVTALITSEYIQALKDAMEKTEMLFVAPVGNNFIGSNNDQLPVYPAGFDIPNLISVASVDNTGNLSFTSNYGKNSVDIAAPGEKVISTAPFQNISYAAQIETEDFRAAYVGFRLDELKYGYELEGDTGGGIGFKTGAAFDENDEKPAPQSAFDDTMSYLFGSKDPEETHTLLITNKLDIFDPEEDDQRADPNELHAYEQFLMQGGYNYTHEFYTGEDEGPSLQELQQYDTVIWYGGNSQFSGQYISDEATDNLKEYLEGGGSLFLSGSTILAGIGESSLMLDTLKIKTAGDGYKGPMSAAEGSIYYGKDYQLPELGIFSSVANNILTRDPLITKISLEHIQDYYWYPSGTDMAASYTAGVAALVLSYRPEMDAAAVKQRLMNSGKSLSSLTHRTISGKMVNAYRALTDFDIPGTPFQGPVVSAQLDAITHKDDVYAIELHTGETLELSLSGVRGTDFDLHLYDSTAKTIKRNDGLIASSENKGTSKESITYKAVKSGTYYINVYAYAGSGYYTLTAHYGNEAGVYEDTNDAVVFSDFWLQQTDASYSGGTLRQIDMEGSAELAFAGSSIEWIGLKDSKQGIADVFIDGVKVASPSLYSETPLVQQTIFKADVPYGHHVIEVKWTGKKDPSAVKGGTEVNVDAFAVSYAIQEYDPSVTFKGTWGASWSTRHSNGKANYSDKKNSSVEIAFNGSEVTVYAYTNSYKGKANIFIDGKLVTPQSVDLYSNTVKYQVPVFKYANLAKGAHTLKIVGSGEKNPASTGYGISFDNLVVSN